MSLRETTCSTRALLIATRQLEALLQGGVMLVEAFETLATQSEDADLREVFLAVGSSLSNGYRLSVAMKQFPGVFPPVYRAMVKVAEETGKLHLIFGRLAYLLEQEWKLNRTIRAALSYPAFVLALTLSMTLALFTTIVPEFAKIFDEVKAELPLLTRVVLGITRMVTSLEFWAVGGLLVFSLWELGKYIQKDTELQVLLAQFIQGVPILGGMVQDGCLARYCASMEVMLGCGLDYLSSIRLAGEASGNPLYEQASKSMVNWIKEGETIQDTMKRAGELFPSAVVQMVAAGEESGKLVLSYRALAVFYDDQLSYRIALLTAALEPILLALISGIVGLTLASVFLPLLDCDSAFLV